MAYMDNSKLTLEETAELSASAAYAKQHGSTITVDGLKPQTEQAVHSFGEIPATADVNGEINRILKDKELTKLAKTHEIFRVVEKWLLAHGKFYSLGKKDGSGMAAWLDNETRKLIEVSRDSNRFAYLLQSFGIQPSTLEAKDLGKNIGCKYGGLALANTVYAMSTMKGGNLYLNQYDGTMLRIAAGSETEDELTLHANDCPARHADPGLTSEELEKFPDFKCKGKDKSGSPCPRTARIWLPPKVEKLRNGDDDVLFNRSGDPLDCDLDKVKADADDWGLDIGKDSLLENHILDTVTYAGEGGIPETQVKRLLTGWLLGLYFQEVVVVPFLLLVTGVPGTMKSSIIRSIGRVIVGDDFNVIPFPKNPDDLKLLAVTRGFVALDESNLTREHEELLNTITTGGEDERRELYTTDKIRRKPFQARIAMTGNASETRQERTSSRVLAVDVAKSKLAEPYRSDADVAADLKRHRNAIWTEIVTRCKNIIFNLVVAEKYGRITHVGHRMSGFAIWYLNAAKWEGWEKDARDDLEVLQARQARQVTEANDDFLSVLESFQQVCGDGIWRTAAIWAKTLTPFVNENDRELRSAVARTRYLQFKFKALETTLRGKYGMETRDDKHNNRREYRFKPNASTDGTSNSQGLPSTFDSI